jgi:hypothetical protein
MHPIISPSVSHSRRRLRARRRMIASRYTYASAVSSALASFRSAKSNPSVNEP